MTEGGELSDGDLSLDAAGKTYNAQSQCTQCFTRLMDNTSFYHHLRAVAQSSDPASLICIRNQLLQALCEIFSSDSLLIKE